MKTNFKLQVNEVTGAWLLITDEDKVPKAFPTTDKGDKELLDAILKQLILHGKFRIGDYHAVCIERE